MSTNDFLARFSNLTEAQQSAVADVVDYMQGVSTTVGHCCSPHLLGEVQTVVQAELGSLPTIKHRALIRLAAIACEAIASK